MTDPRLRPLAMSIGDVAGIGPEIIVKYFNRTSSFPPVLIPAPPAVFKRIFTAVPALFKHRFITRLPARFAADTVYIYEINSSVTAADVATGVVTRPVALLALASLRQATQWCREGMCPALVTMPVNKAVFALAGSGFSGHTEFLQKETGAPRVTMLMWSDELKAVPMTRHIPLKDVAANLPVKELEFVIDQLSRFFTDPTGSGANQLKRKNPRIAVLGLNPHNGENGDCGREEIAIQAALRKLQSRYQISGTFSPDSFFGRKSYRDYNVVIGWYHDQVMIPFKLLAMGEGVNVTLGLPFLRVSVAHGCGYDIAPRFCAEIGSLVTVMKFVLKYGLT